MRAILQMIIIATSLRAEPADVLAPVVIETARVRAKVCYSVSRIKANQNLRSEDLNILKQKYDEILTATASARVAVELGNKKTLLISLATLREEMVKLGEEISRSGQAKGPVLEALNSATKALDIAKSLLVRYLDERKSTREAKKKYIIGVLSWKSWGDIDADGKMCNQ